MKASDWVARRKTAEEHQIEWVEDLYNNVRQSIEDACRSFKEQYGGVAEIIETGDPAVMTVQCEMVDVPYQVPATRVYVQFDAKGLVVLYSGPPSCFWAQRRFHLKSDYDGAFLVSEERDRERLTPDDVSCHCLEWVFFYDGGTTTGWRTTLAWRLDVLRRSG